MYMFVVFFFFFFFSSRRRHTRWTGDWSQTCALPISTKAMRLSAGLEWGSDMGSLISQDQLDTVTAHVDDAVAKGARVLAGGKARPELGPFFYEPTILEGVSPEMVCFGNETFGPVISLYRFHDEADAIARANDGEYGLNAAIYSRD